VNSIGIVAMGQINGLLVGKVDSRRLLAIGLSCNALGGISVAASTVLGLGLFALLPALFVTVASIGLVFPNATALALSGHRETAGSASALLGVLQFMIGGLVSPLVGIAGSDTAVPMGLVMGALSASAVVVFAVLTRRSGIKRAAAQPR
jgi:MFS transporter, DHA1 family, multidrug resistance protein